MSSAITAAVIVGAGAVGAASISADAQKDAAAEAGNAQMYAARVMEQAGQQARLDNILLNSIGLQDFAQGVQLNVNSIIQGTANAERVLHQTTGNADYLLWNGSENAQRAILGLPPAGSPGSQTFAGMTAAGGAGGMYGQGAMAPGWNELLATFGGNVGGSSTQPGPPQVQQAATQAGIPPTPLTGNREQWLQELEANAAEATADNYVGEGVQEGPQVAPDREAPSTPLTGNREQWLQDLEANAAKATALGQTPQAQPNIITDAAGNQYEVDAAGNTRPVGSMGKIAGEQIGGTGSGYEAFVANTQQELAAEQAQQVEQQMIQAQMAGLQNLSPGDLAKLQALSPQERADLAIMQRRAAQGDPTAREALLRNYSGGFNSAQLTAQQQQQRQAQLQTQGASGGALANVAQENVAGQPGGLTPPLGGGLAGHVAAGGTVPQDQGGPSPQDQGGPSPQGYTPWGGVSNAGNRVQTTSTRQSWGTPLTQDVIYETDAEGNYVRDTPIQGEAGIYGTQNIIQRYVDPDTGEVIETPEFTVSPETSQLATSPLARGTFQSGDVPLGIAPAQIDQAQAGPSYAGMGGTGIIQARQDIGMGAGLAAAAIQGGVGRAHEQLGSARGAIDQYAREAAAALGYRPGGGGGAGYYRRGGGGNFSGGAAERFVLQGVPPAAERALSELSGYTEKAVGQLEVFASHGEAAMREASALSGALGAQAQQGAVDAFIESPGQAFLRERAEQALLRNQAAIGGLGGGNVRQELQEQAIGVAATQQQQQIQNLLAVAAQGQQAAGQQGQFQSAAGGQAAGVMGGVARQQVASAGSIASSRINAQAQAQLAAMQLEAQNDRAIADILGTAGVNIAGYYGQGAGYEFMGGQNLADIASGAGANLSNIAMVGGQLLAGDISNTAAQRAGLQTGLGSDLATIYLNQGTQIGGLYNQLGAGSANIRSNTGSTLGNIAVQAGSGVADYTAGAGEYQAAGTIGQANAWGQGIGSLAEIAGGVVGGIAQPTSVTPEPPQTVGLGGR